MASANRTAYTVLGFLTMGPLSGYDIKKLVEASIDNFWAESFGQIYPTLRHLTETGQIEKREDDSAGGRSRHVYSIRDSGRAALTEWLGEPTPPPAVRIELLLKLFFGAHTDRATNRDQILAYREKMVRDLERYGAITKQLQARDGLVSELPYWLLTLRFGERDRQAHIEWCDEALATLDQLPEGAHEPAALKLLLEART